MHAYECLLNKAFPVTLCAAWHTVDTLAMLKSHNNKVPEMPGCPCNLPQLCAALVTRTLRLLIVAILYVAVHVSLHQPSDPVPTPILLSSATEASKHACMHANMLPRPPHRAHGSALHRYI